MTQLPGATAPRSPLRCDEEAFGELARFSGKLKTAFDQNAVDRAIDRLITEPDRNTSGKLLAHRLLRDAQKFLKRKFKREFLDDEIEAENRSIDRPTPLDLFEISEALETIRTGLMNLTVRERQVFMTRTMSAPPEAVGVGKRRFSTLLSDARIRLSRQQEIDEARLVVMRALDMWRWETIALLKPLTVYLASNN